MIYTNKCNLAINAVKQEDAFYCHNRNRTKHSQFRAYDDHENCIIRYAFSTNGYIQQVKLL